MRETPRKTNCRQPCLGPATAWRPRAPGLICNLSAVPRKQYCLNPLTPIEHWEQSLAEWNKFYIRHPDVARLQEEIDRISGGERKTFALRRDDVGYLADTIDLSEMHYMRVLEVRLFAGHEDEFVERLGLLSDGYKKFKRIPRGWFTKWIWGRPPRHF